MMAWAAPIRRQAAVCADSPTAWRPWTAVSRSIPHPEEAPWSARTSPVRHARSPGRRQHAAARGRRAPPRGRGPRGRRPGRRRRGPAAQGRRPQARRRDRRRAHAPDPHRRGPAGGVGDPRPPPGRRRARPLAVHRGGLRDGAAVLERRGRRLPAQGPGRRPRALRRRRAARGGGRQRARPRGRLAAAGPPPPRGPAQPAEPARAQGARAHGRGPLEPRDRLAARRHRARGREARHEHLQQAEPAAGPAGPPARARGADLPARLTADGFVAPPADAQVFRHPAVAGLADVAPSGRVRLDAIARWLQDAALADVVASGLNGGGVWVLRRLRLRVARFPRFGDALEVATFCSGTGALVAERRSTIHAGGEPVVEAVALWVHLDPDGLHPRPLPEGFEAVYGAAAADRRGGGGGGPPGAPPPGG